MIIQTKGMKIIEIMNISSEIDNNYVFHNELNNM